MALVYTYIFGAGTFITLISIARNYYKHEYKAGFLAEVLVVVFWPITILMGLYGLIKKGW